MSAPEVFSLAQSRPGVCNVQHLESLGTAGLFNRGDREKDIWPVYRTSPYRAEAERLAEGSSTAQVLFVDEGQQCR